MAGGCVAVSWYAFICLAMPAMTYAPPHSPPATPAPTLFIHHSNLACTFDDGCLPSTELYTCIAGTGEGAVWEWLGGTPVNMRVQSPTNAMKGSSILDRTCMNKVSRSMYYIFFFVLGGFIATVRRRTGQPALADCVGSALMTASPITRASGWVALAFLWDMGMMIMTMMCCGMRRCGY